MEALQMELDSRTPESGVVFISQNDAREILAENQRLERIAGAWKLLLDDEQEELLREYDRLMSGDVDVSPDWEAVKLPEPLPGGPRTAA